jgi:hypothetical protein
VVDFLAKNLSLSQRARRQRPRRSDDKVKPTEKPGGAGQRFWDFFASVKLSFVLLLSLALASVLGTLLPQKEHVSVYVQQFGEAGARLILGLRLDDMYHAPWFLLLLALLAANLVICSLNRLPLTLKLMAKEPAEEIKRARPAQASLTLSGPPADHLARAEAETCLVVTPCISMSLGLTWAVAVTFRLRTSVPAVTPWTWASS